MGAYQRFFVVNTVGVDFGDRAWTNGGVIFFNTTVNSANFSEVGNKTTETACVSSRGVDVCWWEGAGEKRTGALRFAKSAAAVMQGLPSQYELNVLSEPDIRPLDASTASFPQLPITVNGSYWMAADLILFPDCDNVAYQTQEELHLHAVLSMRGGATEGYDEDSTQFARKLLSELSNDEQISWISNELNDLPECIPLEE